VTGTNSQAGQFKFTIKVTDSSGASATSPAGYGVFSQLVTTQPCATQCFAEEGCTICGNFGSVSGGLQPYHYKITSDNRPPGMGVNGLNLTGAFPAPGPLGAFSMIIQVLDTFGAQHTVYANWAVFAHIALTPTSVICGNSPSSCTLQFSYTGGDPSGNPTPSVTKVGPLGTQANALISLIAVTGGCGPSQSTTIPPPDLTMSASGGVLTVTAGLNKSKSGYCFYSGQITVVLTDQSPCGPGNCVSNAVTIDISI
jgi:hypothetical protein